MYPILTCPLWIKIDLPLSTASSIYLHLLKRTQQDFNPVVLGADCFPPIIGPGERIELEAEEVESSGS